MAVDTATKRAGALKFPTPGTGVPDGTIDATDRAVTIGAWLAAAAATPGLEITLEVAWGTAEDTVPSSWTDISDYLFARTDTSQYLSVTRGRDLTLPEQPSPGELTATLRDPDRRFDQTYESGAYYPNVTEGQWVRLTASWDGTSYVIYEGFTQEFPLSWGLEMYAALHAVDRLGRLAQVNVGTNVSSEIVGVDPIVFLRLDEATGNIATDSGENGENLDYGGSYVLNDDGYSLGGVPEYVKLTGGDIGGGSVQPPPTAEATFSFWVRPLDTQNDSDVVVFHHGFTNPTSRIAYHVEFDKSVADDKVAVYFAQDNNTGSGGTRFEISDSANRPDIDDDAWHHVAIRRHSSGLKFDLFIDGVLNNSDVTTTDSPETGDCFLEIADAPHAHSWTGYQGHIGDLMVFSGALSDSQIVALAAGGTFGGAAAGTAASAVVTAILDAVSVPAAKYNVETTAAGLAAYIPSASDKAAPALRSFAEQELGLCYVDRTGILQFRNRWYTGEQVDSVVPQFGHGGYRAKGDRIVPVVDSHKAGRAIGKLANGASQYATHLTDLTDIAQARAVDLGSTRYNQTDDLDDVLGYLLEWYSNDVLTLHGFTVNPHTDDDLWDVLLPMDIGDRVQYVHRLGSISGTPNVTFDLIVVGIEHNIAPGDWETRLYCVEWSRRVQFGTLVGHVGGPDLGAFWPCDDNGSPTDESGNGRDFTNVTGTPTRRTTGEFTGELCTRHTHATADELQSTTEYEPDLTAAWTWIGRAKAVTFTGDTTDSEGDVEVWRWGADATSGFSVQFDGGGDGILDNIVCHDRQTGGGSITGTPIGAGSSLLGNWYDLAVTYDGTTLRFYVDGTEVGTALTTTMVQPATSLHMTMGGGDRGTAGDATWSVDVQHVGFIERKLSAAEISRLASYGPL